MEQDKIEYYNSLPEKDFRKAFNLPVTKQLVHYKSRWTGEKEYVVSVKLIDISEMHGWATFEIVTESGRTITINGKYFESMQKSSFMDDMRKSDMALENYRL